MARREVFDDFFSDKVMEIIALEHGRYIEFTIEDNSTDEILSFKLSHKDYSLLESILLNTKKEY